jgi:hypothetical protein
MDHYSDLLTMGRTLTQPDPHTSNQELLPHNYNI